MPKLRDTSAAPTTEPRAVDLVAGLAGSIAHDFSNMLMVIRNVGGFLREDLDAADPRQELVSDLLNAADRARQLTEQLQAIGRSQLLKPELVWPAEVANGFADTLRHLVPDDVEFDIAVRARDVPVMFDPSQLPILMMRLLSYAAERARSHGRLLLTIDVREVDAKEAKQRGVTAGEYVGIVIANTAERLDDAEQHRVFEPRLAGRHAPRGTDLRLASVHGVVRQTGGFVDVSSDPGRGLSLGAYLPAAKRQVREAPVSKPIRLMRESHGNEVVLVVEDDAAVRNTVRQALERFGYTVLVAADGDAALRLVQMLTQPPDLLLTDLVMPEVTGRELVENLGLRGQLPKVLLMSGYTDDDVVRRARPTEMYPFIKKPFTHHELAAKVRETLDAKPPRTS